ncbi:MAG: hypothetical protein V1897_10445 [Pseudomonadota bacterium]
MTNLADRPLKADPNLFDTEEKLRKGNFLRGESRQLSRLLEDDMATVNKIDLDIELVTNEMERLHREAVKGFGDSVIVDGKYEVTVREDRGKLVCPFGDKFFAPKTVVHAVNVKNGRSINYSILAMHMIRNHCFFQGSDSPFRIEPLELREFFS